MFSMCSELAPRAHIPDTRIPQLMQPCLDAFQLNLVTVEPLSQVLKSSIKEEGSCGKPVIFDFTSSPPHQKNDGWECAPPN